MQWGGGLDLKGNDHREAGVLLYASPFRCLQLAEALGEAAIQLGAGHSVLTNVRGGCEAVLGSVFGSGALGWL